MKENANAIVNSIDITLNRRLSKIRAAREVHATLKRDVKRLKRVLGFNEAYGSGIKSGKRSARKRRGAR